MTLQRKTPLTRQTSQPSGIAHNTPRSELKRSPLPRRRKTPRKHVCDSFRAIYKESEPVCELADSFPVDQADRRQSAIPWQGEAGSQAHAWTVSLNRHAARASELHHIFGGIQGCTRLDEVSFVIHLSADSHTWCERYADDALTLCIAEKLRKGELDQARVEAVLDCGAGRLGEWLSGRKPVWEFAVRVWAPLCRTLGSLDVGDERAG